MTSWIIISNLWKYSFTSVIGAGKLGKECAEGRTASPGAFVRPRVHVPEKGVEYSYLVVRRSSGDNFIVRMPVDGGHRRAQGLLDVFRDPPVVLLGEVTYGYDSVAGPHGEFIFCNK